MHASFSELCDFVRALRPAKVTPCVVNNGRTSKSIEELFSPFLAPSPVRALQRLPSFTFTKPAIFFSGFLRLSSKVQL